MKIINQRKFKTNQRSITESTACMTHMNIQEKYPNIRQNKQILQQHHPLKSQIIYLGQQKQGSNNDAIKKKHYRYLRYDTSKDQDNAKSLNKSLSKSKTSSTQSLRIHKIRSITRQIEQKHNKIEGGISTKIISHHNGKNDNHSQSQSGESKEIHEKESKKMIEDQKRIKQIETKLLKLNQKISEIQKDVKIPGFQSNYQKLRAKNRLAGVKIITKIISKKHKFCAQQVIQLIQGFSHRND